MIIYKRRGSKDWIQKLKFYDVFPTYEDIKIVVPEISEETYLDLKLLIEDKDLFTSSISKFKINFKYEYQNEKQRYEKYLKIAENEDFKEIKTLSETSNFDYNDTPTQEDNFINNKQLSKTTRQLGFSSTQQVYQFINYWEQPKWRVLNNLMEKLVANVQPNEIVVIKIEGDNNE